MRSAPANQVKNYILGYLINHGQTNIDKIQFALKRHFPEVYKKNSNLTQIHRHLRDLKERGLIVSITTYETLYNVSERFRRYCDWLIDLHRNANLNFVFPAMLFDFTVDSYPYWTIFNFILDRPATAKKWLESFHVHNSILEEVKEWSDDPMSLNNSNLKFFKTFIEWYAKPLSNVALEEKERLEWCE